MIMKVLKRYFIFWFETKIPTNSLPDIQLMLIDMRMASVTMDDVTRSNTRRVAHGEWKICRGCASWELLSIVGGRRHLGQ